MLNGRRRTGATLLELLVALTLVAVIAAGVARSRAATRSAGTRAIADAGARQQRRAAMAALPATLLALAPAAGDVRVAEDTALEVRATLGSAVLCAVDSSAGVATLSGIVDDSPWLSPPHAGDTLLVLGHQVTGEWAWRSLAAIGDASAAHGPCLADAPTVSTWRTPIAPVAPVTPVAPVATVPALAATPALVRGAAVRLVRRVRWSVYRAGDGRWYLGYREAGATGLSGVQPVSGPHDVPPVGESGARRAAAISFAYRDALGRSTAEPSRVARIDVILRDDGAGAVANAHPHGVLLSVAPRHAPAP